MPDCNYRRLPFKQHARRHYTASTVAKAVTLPGRAATSAARQLNEVALYSERSKCNRELHAIVDGLANVIVQATMQNVLTRRKYLSLVGGMTSVSLWRPMPVCAQQFHIPQIGVLVVTTEAPLGPFRESLRELGYVQGKTINIEVRSAEGQATRLPELARQFVRDKKDVIVAVLTPAITAAKNATHTIPIVMAPAGDPVGTGLVASLARPGGNITGVSATGTEATGKTLELIREALPSTRKVGMLLNADDPFSKPLLEQTTQAAARLGVELSTHMIGGPDDIEPAFVKMAQQECQAIIVQGSLPVQPTIDLSLKYRLPALSHQESMAHAGALMSYSSSYAERAHVVAAYVDKLIKGAKPAELPVQEPTRYELVLNLKTANALGLTIPATILVRADEVIN
jgi:putative ABC transport system substrate-binding protein